MFGLIGAGVLFVFVMFVGALLRWYSHYTKAAIEDARKSAECEFKFAADAWRRTYDVVLEDHRKYVANSELKEKQHQDELRKVHKIVTDLVAAISRTSGTCYLELDRLAKVIERPVGLDDGQEEEIDENGNPYNGATAALDPAVTRTGNSGTSSG